MQQGYEPWWDSSLQCTRCPAIGNCRVVTCTTGTDAQCVWCTPGHYAFRHNEDTTRCLANSLTIAAAGFTPNAVGAFLFKFVGALPSDLNSGGAITVPHTASLSLVGTGVEAIAVSFNVQGSLSLAALCVTGGSTTAISVAASGSLTVTQATFTGTNSSVAISVAAGGGLTVSASHLVDNTRHHTLPFPCDGTLAHGCAGAHAGAVTMHGPMGITVALPLVCDAASERCVAAARCPAHATLVPGSRYCSDMVGSCEGPGGGALTTRVSGGITRPACQASCDAAPACVGYTYRNDGTCWVHGPGLDTDLAGGWSANTHPSGPVATTIVGASGYSLNVCAAVAEHN
jgi:hypothetical protein